MHQLQTMFRFFSSKANRFSPEILWNRWLRINQSSLSYLERTQLSGVFFADKNPLFVQFKPIFQMPAKNHVSVGDLHLMCTKYMIDPFSLRKHLGQFFDCKVLFLETMQIFRKEIFTVDLMELGYDFDEFSYARIISNWYLMNEMRLKNRKGVSCHMVDVLADTPLTIFSDGSFLNSSKISGCGCIMVDRMGRLWAMGCWNLGYQNVSSPIFAELSGVIHSMRLAEDLLSKLGYRLEELEIKIVCDNQSVLEALPLVKFLGNDSQTQNLYLNLQVEQLELHRLFKSVDYHFLNREWNAPADFLSKLGRESITSSGFIRDFGDLVAYGFSKEDCEKVKKNFDGICKAGGVKCLDRDESRNLLMNF